MEGVAQLVIKDESNEDDGQGLDGEMTLSQVTVNSIRGDFRQVRTECFHDYAILTLIPTLLG